MKFTIISSDVILKLKQKEKCMQKLKHIITNQSNRQHFIRKSLFYINDLEIFLLEKKMKM